MTKWSWLWNISYRHLLEVARYSYYWTQHTFAAISSINPLPTQFLHITLDFFLQRMELGFGQEGRRSHGESDLFSSLFKSGGSEAGALHSSYKSYVQQSFIAEMTIPSRMYPFEAPNQDFSYAGVSTSTLSFLKTQVVDATYNASQRILGDSSSPKVCFFAFVTYSCLCVCACVCLCACLLTMCVCVRVQVCVCVR